MRNEAGIILEKISGFEELQLIYIYVKNRIYFGNERYVISDIGGGSVEVSEDRADVILPVALVHERLAILAGTKEVINPHAELREGVVIYLFDGNWYKYSH